MEAPQRSRGHLWTATLVNYHWTWMLCMGISRKKRNKATKHCFPCVRTLTFFKEFIVLALNDKVTSEFVSNVPRNNNNCLFFLWVSADSDGYHITSLCHPRNFVYMHWKIKTTFRVPILPYIILKSSKPTQPPATVLAEPELFLSLYCFPAAPVKQRFRVRILKRIQGSFPLPSWQQQQIRGMLWPCLRSPNPSMRHPHSRTLPCLSIELIN